MEPTTESRVLLDSERYRAAKTELLRCIVEAGQKIRGVKPSSQLDEASGQLSSYEKMIQEFTRDRGRDLYYPFVSSGLGSGPFVELMDGSVKYDLITGIGINFFGHAHTELISEMLDAMSADTMQGNLQPGHEARELIRAVLAKVGDGCRIKHGWLLCSGTMSNEIALKIIRQRRAPATKVLAFNDCFAGRSTAMQEITDNPKYREGQPVYGEVDYLPFYDPKVGLEASTDATLRAMKEKLNRYPDKFAALMIELVQGEGGFNYAPREFYVKVFETAKKAGLAIWVDEIQTFGRTGELFAYQKFGLNEYVDVVTIGKMLQACMVLFTEEYNPKPGLVAGTFSGSTVALRTGKKVVEMLSNEGYLGKDGRIEKASARFVENLKKIGPPVSDIRAIGGMIAFMPFSGTMEEVKSVLMRLFEMGVVAFYCGHGPYLIRLLPPLGGMSDSEIDQVCALIGQALAKVAEKQVIKK